LTAREGGPNVESTDLARQKRGAVLPRVQFTRHLKLHFPELADVEVDADSLAELVRTLDGMHPGLAAYLTDEHGTLRKHVNIFINDDLLDDRDALRDRVGPGDRVFIMQALSGG
jgi:hypothetical protein